MSVTDEIKAQIDIVDLVSESVALQRSGQTFKARCPFHAEKTPSFVVDPRRQTWRCFGACAEGGDAFSWVMKREGVEFREALTRLAQRAGVRLEPRSPESEARDEARKRLLAANEAALAWWRQLLEAQEGQTARDYLAQRGLDAESVEQFAIGVAPSEPDGLSRRLGARGFRSEELERAGLVVVTEQGPRDRFRDRLMFPIRSARGELVGFGGRTLIDEPAKYVNTPESPLFEKRSLLYGLNLARDAIRRAGHVIVVEGYTDVISAHTHGTPQTVASMGTSLTESQLKLLEPLTRDIRFALDADTAGASATQRSKEAARAALAFAGKVVVESGGPTYPGRSTEEAFDFRVIRLPQGNDPDALIRSDPQLWSQLIDEAPPLVDWVLDRIRVLHDLDSPGGRSSYAVEATSFLASVDSPFLRTEYQNRLARELGVDVSELPRPPRSRQRRYEANVPAEEQETWKRPVDLVQEYLVQLAIHRREAADELDSDVLNLIEGAELREILAARLTRGDDTDWQDQLLASTRDLAESLLKEAQDLPPMTEDDARLAARDVTQRLITLRTRESLRLQSQNIARIEEQLDRSAVAEAAAAFNAGGADDLNEELSEAAARVVQARDDALSLHHRRRGGQPRDDDHERTGAGAASHVRSRQ